MKIYLAGSISAGRKYEKNLQLIADRLKKLGHTVLTDHFVVKLDEDETNNIHKLSKRKAIMAEDKGLIRECDAFIAEVSTYSHGVGYEHGYAESLEKPVLILRDKSLEGQPHSAFLDGTDHEKFMFAFYDKENINKILITFFRDTTS